MQPKAHQRKINLQKKMASYIWHKGNGVYFGLFHFLLKNSRASRKFVIDHVVYATIWRKFASLPEKFALYATAFSRYAPLNVEPLKSDSLISADVKLALLYQTIT